ncbi:hypothetical protein CSB45_00615 [candidate division KSB3 bacterium]|uniref:Prepilin-type N-terminal cleavage/methylation domain-containing protein n=1 Tax=candidate division KSB3 bacterium TaxID=2044937 RepID=A0A2G6EDU0_9BACT|nr:MAG: hypothetical protein CSB45_00615 [candidate division KSB3 bacterium]
MSSQAGFSLLEMLVSTTILLIVFAMVGTAFLHSRKISLCRRLEVDTLQNARIAIDEMTRTFRAIGFHRDKKNGQVALIEAAPFQIIFNADLSDSYDVLPPAIPLTFLYDAGSYVTPLQHYTSGAEMYRWTLDTNEDGLVDRHDVKDNAEERLTPNPDDMVLNRECYGVSDTGMALGVDEQIVTGLLGPYDAEDQRSYVTPMFQYWLRDHTLGLHLLGDGDGNGKLEGDELYFDSITGLSVLKTVERIDITVTAAAPRKDPFDHLDYYRVSLTSSVFLRNMR